MNSTGSRPRSPPLPTSPRGRESRALKLGILASVVLHLLIFAVLPLVTSQFGVLPRAADRPEDEEPSLPGMEVVVIQEVVEPAEPTAPEPTPAPPPDPDEPEPDPELEPDPAPPAEVAAAPPEAEVEPEEDPDDPEPELTIAERLQPQLIDPRLWAPVDPDLTGLTDQERAELLLRGMIQDWNDSVAVAEALSDRARDWTYTDAEGRRWGLAPGRLHLGDFSIPLPFAFEIPPGLRDQQAERQWLIDDLTRGTINAQIQETWAERARVIRERMEAERSRSDDASDGGG